MVVKLFIYIFFSSQISISHRYVFPFAEEEEKNDHIFEMDVIFCFSVCGLLLDI